MYIQFGSEKIHYELCWSNKRKTLGISVRSDKVSVTAPEGTTEEKIKQLLMKKAPWIRKQLQDYQEINPFMQERDFFSGEKLPYLGRLYRLKVVKEANLQTSHFKFQQGTFIATVPDFLSETEYRHVIYPLYKAWVIARATTFTQERLHRFTVKVREKPTNIQIKEQKQRWGSCTPDGKILLNWRIFLAPASVVDYVLVHELAHLKDMNHSADFWNTIKMILPNYEDKKEWLRINGRKLYV